MALHEVTPDFKDRRMWRFCWNQKAVKSRHCALLLMECFNVPKWPCRTLILAVNTLMQCPVPFCLSPYFCIPSLVGNLLWRKVEGALCGLQFPRPHVWMCTSRPLHHHRRHRPDVSNGGQRSQRGDGAFLRSGTSVEKLRRWLHEGNVSSVLEMGGLGNVASPFPFFISPVVLELGLISQVTDPYKGFLFWLGMPCWKHQTGVLIVS